MNTNIKLLLNDFLCNKKIHAGATLNLNGLELPSDFLSIYTDCNGGEGFIGDEYLILWKGEELISFNEEYEVAKYAPDIFLFGSNGGGEGFGFDIRNKPYKIVQIPFIGMDMETAIKIADNFTQLLEKMKVSDGSLF